ncbi:MAG: N-acetylornithine carbamoyltransferase [Chthoniobacterales bacterium]
MKHATRLSDLGPEVVAEILATAILWKTQPARKHLRDKLLGMLFLNPSLRTRASFEAVMARGGGSALALEAGSTSWKLEDRPGAIMDGDRPEHLREAIPVLCRYLDALAVRAFATGPDDESEREPLLNAIKAHATVPIVSMEGAREHPCQGLADLMTIEENFGLTKGLPVALLWAPHIKPLPKAVPQSFLLTAAMRGCDIRVAHPPGFELHPQVIREAESYATQSGGKVSLGNELEVALAGTRVVYAKAWGPATASGLAAEEVKKHPSWMTSPAHLQQAAADAIFLHCLPVRRNVEVADAVLDSPWSRVIDQAENRFHVQRALLDWLFRP